MGYVREKYTREYFLCQTGKPGVGADGLEYFHKKQPHPRISAALDAVGMHDKSILDIGFGRGEALRYCLEHGAKSVHGVDFSPAALLIARQHLMEWILLEPHRIKLLCMDMLSYIEADTTGYDLVTMFDVLEHIPRVEAHKVLEWVRARLNPYGQLIVTTPFYKVDNDVIMEGLSPEARDSSDSFPETQGMHCNRYTRASLRSNMAALGFEPVDDLLTIWRTA